MSEWPSGLRRQTQGVHLPPNRRFKWEFWSSYEGRGSNPLSDTNTSFLITISVSHTNVLPMEVNFPTWGYSSVVEHSAAVRQVPGSNPGVPYHAF